MTKKEVEEALSFVAKKYKVEIYDRKLWMRHHDTITIDLDNILQIQPFANDIWIHLKSDHQTITLSLNSYQIHTSL